MADVSQITNFVPVTDLLGTAGQPSAEQLADVKNAGYDLVVNLAPSDSNRALADEGDLVIAQGMDYMHIPVDWEAPDASDFEAFAETLNANPDTRVFVHCVMNMRASAFTFLYRIIHQGVDPAEAKAVMRQVWDPQGVWEEFVDEVLSAHGVDYFDID